uniref:neural cell adhesion molecule 2-like isoform X3 n=1 Tax=Styela clava TaxID=7725 RepID=UPI00193AC457|nr:neural cell adhesion molecule 2-like isoform X3 [Styela clava]
MRSAIFIILLCRALAESDEMDEIWIRPASDKTVPIGSDYSLSCHYVTEVISQVKWVSPDNVEMTHNPPKVLIEKEAGLQILTLNKITEQDTGMYHCQGFSNSANNTVRKSRVISAYEPVRIVNTPSVQIFEIGTTATVLCSAKGRPEPTIIWLDGTDKIETNLNEKFSMEEGSSNLIIKNISKAEERNFTCKARELGQGQNKKKEIQVFVYVPPVIQNFEKALTTTEGATTVLICDATGDPVPTYSWYKGDGSVLDESTFILDGTALELSVSSDMNEESFACVARNAIGTDVASVLLTVNVRPTFSVSSGDKVREKGQAILRCIAEGDPLPEVYFYRDDIMLQASDPMVTDMNSTVDYNTTFGSGVWSTNRIVTYNGNEAIVNFTYTTYQDNGKYECRATNVAGIELANVFLDVEYAPKSTLLNNVWSCEGTLATLECQFAANPPANLSWGRYSTVEGTDEMDLENFNKYYITDTPDGVFISKVGDILTLTIDTDIVPDPWGSYYCLARNIIGSNNASAVLNKAEAPDAPIGVQISDIGTRKATVSFTALQPLVDNNYFTIRLTPASPNASDVTQNIGPQMSEYTFQDLEQNMKYTVIVEAVNCEDTSPPSEVKDFKTEPIETPESVEIISGDSSENHDKYLVQWKTRGLGGGEVSKLIVIVEQLTETIDSQNRTKVREILLKPGDQEFENESVIIENLVPSSKYEISVVVYNEVGSAKAKRMFNTAMEFGNYTMPTPGNLTDDLTTDLTFEPQTQTTVSNSTQVSLGGFAGWKILLIIILVLVILVVLIDVICCFTRSWGVTMWIYARTCGESNKHNVEDAEEGAAQFSQPQADAEEINLGAVGVVEENQPIANEAEPIANGEPAIGKLAPIDEQTPLRNDNDGPDSALTPSGNGKAEVPQEPDEEKVEKTKSPEEEKLVKTEENGEKA